MFSFKSQKVDKKSGEYDFQQKCNIVPAANVGGVWRGSKATIQVGLLTSTIGRIAAKGTLKGKLGVPLLMSYNIEDEPSSYPLPASTSHETSSTADQLEVSSIFDIEESKRIPYLTISDYHEMYRSKKTTPTEVVEKLISECENFMTSKSKEGLTNYEAIREIKEDIIREQAKASSERFAKGSSLSVLDGVPFFSKEEIPVKDYTRRYGSDLCDEICPESALVIKKLTDAGAIHCGTTNMVMFGSSTIGCNPLSGYGSPKNPNNPQFYCGGSSCGCACVVSAGLVPFSVAVDGLGSIRIPASVCGVVGFKATYSRVSLSEHLSSKQFSSHYGPIACCVRDAAIVYGTICGPDPKYEIGTHQPLPILPNLSPLDLSTVKFAVSPSHFQLASPEVVTLFTDLISKIKCQHKGNVTEINIPEMHESCCAMSILATQNAKNIRDKIGEENFSKIKDSFSRMNNTLGLDFSDEEVVQSKKQCTRMIGIVSKIFETVDFILLPTVASTAYERTEYDDSNGVVDVEYLHGATMYSFLASLTGVPSVSVKLGFSKETKLPFGLQILAPWWKEHSLLQCANSFEKIIECYNSPLPNLGKGTDFSVKS